MMHASDAAALFAAPGDEDKDIEDNIDRGGDRDELDVDGWDSRGGCKGNLMIKHKAQILARGIQRETLRTPQVKGDYITESQDGEASLKTHAVKVSHMNVTRCTWMITIEL